MTVSTMSPGSSSKAIDAPAVAGVRQRRSLQEIAMQMQAYSQSLQQLKAKLDEDLKDLKSGRGLHSSSTTDTASAPVADLNLDGFGPQTCDEQCSVPPALYDTSRVKSVPSSWNVPEHDGAAECGITARDADFGYIISQDFAPNDDNEKRLCVNTCQADAASHPWGMIRKLGSSGHSTAVDSATTPNDDCSVESSYQPLRSRAGPAETTPDPNPGVPVVAEHRPVERFRLELPRLAIATQQSFAAPRTPSIDRVGSLEKPIIMDRAASVDRRPFFGASAPIVVSRASAAAPSSVCSTPRHQPLQPPPQIMSARTARTPLPSTTARAASRSPEPVASAATLRQPQSWSNASQSPRPFSPSPFHVWRPASIDAPSANTSPHPSARASAAVSSVPQPFPIAANSDRRTVPRSVGTASLPASWVAPPVQTPNAVPIAQSPKEGLASAAAPPVGTPAADPDFLRKALLQPSSRSNIPPWVRSALTGSCAAPAGEPVATGRTTPPTPWAVAHTHATQQVRAVNTAASGKPANPPALPGPVASAYPQSPIGLSVGMGGMCSSAPPVPALRTQNQTPAHSWSPAPLLPGPVTTNRCPSWVPPAPPLLKEALGLTHPDQEPPFRWFSPEATLKREPSPSPAVGTQPSSGGQSCARPAGQGGALGGAAAVSSCSTADDRRSMSLRPSPTEAGIGASMRVEPPGPSMRVEGSLISMRVEGPCASMRLEGPCASTRVEPVASMRVDLPGWTNLNGCDHVRACASSPRCTTMSPRPSFAAACEPNSPPPLPPPPPRNFGGNLQATCSNLLKADSAWAHCGPTVSRASTRIVGSHAALCPDSFDYSEPMWLRPPFGAQHQVAMT